MTMTAPMEPRVDPLNSVLFALLEHKFGEVRIANEGVPAYIQRLADPLRPGRIIERGGPWGEYYRVNCPFCVKSPDTRQRLWVNHMYGSDYEKNRRKYTHLAVCYNENCIEREGMRERLEKLIFGNGRPVFRKVVIKAATADFVQQVVAPPGEICSIAGLYDAHPAVTYVRSRGFDEQALAQQFDIGVCTNVPETGHKIMRNRIYIPITFNQQLVSWQGRVVTGTSDMKYYNCPGTRKSCMLYNYDNARSEPYVVVVEGVPSVWRVGRPAVALFGKTMSLWQQTTISTTWAGKPIILMLDHDARECVDQAAGLLRARGADVRPIYLPDERDPADYTAGEVADMIAGVL